MSYVSRFIWIFLYCCLNTVKAQTGDSDPGLVPEGSLIYIDNPWNHTLNLPKSDVLCAFCGIRVNVTARWETAPVSNAEYTIKFTFEHPNFEETKTDDVMKIPYDKIVTHKDINICFSPGPVMDKNVFTLYAETDNIPVENLVDIQVTVEMDYSGHCHTKTNSKEGIDLKEGLDLKAGIDLTEESSLNEQSNSDELFPYEIWIHRILFVATLLSVPVGFLIYRKKGSYSIAQDLSDVDSLQGGPSGVGAQSGGPTGFFNHGLGGDTSSSSSAAGGENPNEVVVKSPHGRSRGRPKDTKEKKEQ